MMAGTGGSPELLRKPESIRVKEARGQRRIPVLVQYISIFNELFSEIPDLSLATGFIHPG